MLLTWMYFTVMLFSCVNIIMQMYFTVMYSDLKDDFINPIDLCKKVNRFVLPDMLLHALGSFILLFSGAWFSFLLNTPLLAWNVSLILGGMHLHDSTTIFKDLSAHQKRSFFRLFCYTVDFFMYLFLFVQCLVNE
ncbi:cornichon family protein [Schizosaccharomyces japonicus yFS275]|uniref:Cornichon family protein n=1 Tax=Schizosaccharomyces japonicus (strain yFS275 / FY16936) TaxID=402676 RepID=B6K7M4_SCHJY|nr:cornichon family protein [Schizosaccharomyces japonicus yFS275]EEB09528.1 cornichon family protein [Schizosaccharomyces japonicus yFS275]